MRRTDLHRLVFAAGLACVSGTAMACPPLPPEDSASAGQQRVIIKQQAQSGGGNCEALPLVAQHAVTAFGGLDDTVSFVTKSEDGRSIAIEMVDGKVQSAKVDGKAVPSERVKVDGSHIIVLDGDGKELTRLKNISSTKGATWNAKAAKEKAAIATSRAPLAKAYTFSEPPVQPKVMVGVILDDLTGPLAEHFGLTEEEATLLTAVDSDLPAGKGGLKPYDIIVSIDGKSPCGVTAFREGMSKKNPGDTVTFGVISKGVKRNVTITLEKFDADRLKAKLPVPAMAPEAPEAPEPPAGADLPGMNTLRDRLKGLEQLRGGGMGQIFEGPEGNSFMVLPEHQRELDKKLTKLSERLEKMEELLRKVLAEKAEKKP